MGFNTKKGKKKKFFPFKLPTAITILFLLILLIIIISWIPGTTKEWVDDQGVSHGGGPLGILDLFNAPIQGFAENVTVIIFILIIGGYLGIVMKSKALDAGIGRLVKKLNGKEIWIIPAIMIILSIGGTVEGMCEETIPYYLIIIPALLAAGFDVITGVLVILLGAGVGVMFSTLNPFAIGAASAVSNISVGDGLIWRLVCWILGTAGTIGFVMWYALKVKRNPTKSIVYDLQKEHHETFLTNEQLPEFTKKRKIILGLFGLTFVVMIFCIVPWDRLIFGDEGGIFKDANDWLKIHFPYITGRIPAFGDWTILTLGFFFFFASIIIAAIDWHGEENYVKDFVSGSSELLGVAFIIAVASGIGWALSSSGMDKVVLDSLSGTISGLPKTALVLIGFLIFLILAFFIPSTSGLAAAAFPVISGLVAPLGLQSGMITAFVMASGWINLFAPSAGIMMAGLAISKVPLTKFYQAIWPYTLGITVFILGMLAIGTLLPNSIF
ncbi:MAG: YfcC family protein [Spiroplasma sp.]|nr:YfcC family protein [Spiroplasma sp.]